MSQDISIELVFATPDSQVLREMIVPAKATVGSAVAASGLDKEFPDYPITDLPTGIWGRRVDAKEQLKEGDRLEIYRELPTDPMAARRLRASEPGPGPE